MNAMCIGIVAKRLVGKTTVSQKRACFQFKQESLW